MCVCVSCVQRYLYYINNGVDTEHVAPLEDSWITNILDRVGSGNSLVARFTGGVEFLSDEVREEYLLSVKKSIGEGNTIVIPVPVYTLCAQCVKLDCRV